MNTFPKRLIIHADDLGLAHSVTEATIEAMRRGVVSSSSAMVPCVGFEEVVAINKANPSLDIGIHLTLTSEWKSSRWGPVTKAKKLRSLVNSEGFFWPTTRAFVQNAIDEEVKQEVRSQIESALRAGMHPTHLDCHMFALYQTSAHIKLLFEIASEYSIPVAVPSTFFNIFRFDPGDQKQESPLTISKIPDKTQPKDWLATYLLVLKSIPDGLHQIIVHCGFDEPELRQITTGQVRFGSEWRQRDFDVITSPSLKKVLREEKIALVSWRELSEEA